MERDRKHLSYEIARLKESIRRKYRLFKQGILDTEIQLEKQYEPLLNELRKPEKNISVKTEPKKEEFEEQFDFKPSTVSSPITPTASDSLDYEDSQTTERDNWELDSLSKYINEVYTHPLTREYMKKLYKDREGKERTVDDIYGPRYPDGGQVLMIGDSPLSFDSDGKIRVKNVSYKPTKGLYSLIFKRVPDKSEYTNNDLIAYKDILIKTNAHKKGYQQSGQMNRNSSRKYQSIIKTLFPPNETHEGTGLITKTLTSHEKEYWDDPNELVDRLRLLVISAEAGNTSHKNEIINILEELREVGIIRGTGNKRLNLLLQ